MAITEIFESLISGWEMVRRSKITIDMYLAESHLRVRQEYDIADKATLDRPEQIFPSRTHGSVYATKVGSTKSVLMGVTCQTPDSFAISLDVPFFSPNSDPWTSASGDPHFKQIVLDNISLKTESVCYDVTGSPGDYLHIAGFSSNGIQVYGQLKDDYYIHRIYIKSDCGKISALTNFIIIDNGQQINWNMQEITFKSKCFEYLITGNTILITSFLQPGKTIKIQKSIHSLSEIHLDARFKLSPKDYKEMNGLIGNIGKKKYKFHSKVQSDGNMGSKFISIDIDNKLMKGEKVERNKEECWLINVDNVLKPFKISKYVFVNTSIIL
ncbi:DgyrCDS14668 [Dimorphilus gyrociliatus]|uniref:DgyrCDS14668 n=1 Tax=Dimorphilus gyrociliatus TaxID=2664684 RepID=A0A7I8WEN8_9ANNE|nr:DgyrCDS14668 [Dimorphilus gyrociliatus]